jgi:8-oxo-dGTP pyrophosphatase MutT (NUDIX family)
VTEYIQHIRRIVGHDELLQVPSVSIAARDDRGRVLLARHAEGDFWVFPGGTIEPGETPSDAAVREMWEETGLMVQLTRLVGVFGGAEYIIHYQNGDRTSYVMALFEARVVGGRFRPDGVEILELRFVSEDEAALLRTVGWVPEALRAIFGGADSATFRQPTWAPPASADVP